MAHGGRPLAFERRAMSVWKAVSPEAAGVMNTEGKRYRRKHRGKVIYEVVGALADYSYERHYHFTNYLIVLKRLTHGTASRQIGSTTSVVEPEFRIYFEEVTDAS